MSEPVRLLVGLGNPGPRYEATRHNAGFWLVDRLAARHAGSFRPTAKHHGETCELRLAGGTLRVLKPTTYMNHSGRSVAAATRFYRYPVESVLVAHDEIDLPPGTVRLKRGGGHGGHNGLRDVIPALGDPGFARIRIGVGHPGHRDEVVDYVLRRASAAEQRAIDDAIERVLDCFDDIAGGRMERAMAELHRRARERGAPDDG